MSEDCVVRCKRYSTAFFQAARHDGLHRDKSPHADLTLGSVGRSFVQTVAGGGRNEIMLMFCVCILYGMLVVYCAKAMQQRVCTQIPDHRREYSCLRGLLKCFLRPLIVCRGGASLAFSLEERSQEAADGCPDLLFR